MGLAVHYRFRVRGTKDEVVARLEALRAQFLELPVRSVEPIVEVAHLTGGRTHSRRRPRNRITRAGRWALSRRTKPGRFGAPG